MFKSSRHKATENLRLGLEKSLGLKPDSVPVNVAGDNTDPSYPLVKDPLSRTGNVATPPKMFVLEVTVFSITL